MSTPQQYQAPHAQAGMIALARSTWPLLFGIGVLMLGNGLQGSLLGVRAEHEGFGNTLTGLIMSGFFTGFLLGSTWTPRAVRQVGHIRVFAALACVASISILVHELFVEPVIWGLMRFTTGLCYAGIFVVAESWLNDRASNQNRGQLLAIYMAVTFAGMGGGQLLLNAAPPTQSDLFILVSILISFAVVPILLSARPGPEARAPTPVGLRRLYAVSPLGTVGTFAAGITNGTVFGMGAVYARQAGLSIAEVSLFMGALIAGAALLQWPIGKTSDVIDRRKVITVTTFAAAGVALIANLSATWSDVWLLVMAAAFGGLSLTIHSLCLAYTNDYLDPGEMVAASSGLVLVLGVGSIVGPMMVGWIMDLAGPDGFFWWLAAVHVAIGLFAIWRMTRREARPADEQGAYVIAPARLSPVAAAAAEHVYAGADASNTDSDDEISQETS